MFKITVLQMEGYCDDPIGYYYSKILLEKLYYKDLFIIDDYYFYNEKNIIEIIESNLDSDIFFIDIDDLALDPIVFLEYLERGNNNLQGKVCIFIGHDDELNPYRSYIKKTKSFYAQDAHEFIYNDFLFDIIVFFQLFSNKDLIRFLDLIQLNVNHVTDNLQSIINLQAIENKESQNLIESLFSLICELLNTKDVITTNHMKRVAVHSRRIAENMKLDLKIIESIYYGALIHDIGKLIINETILNKPGDLKDTEFREMAAHVTCGMRISERINNSIIKNIITLHHEKTDGTGYPFKYKSSQIPIEAKIVSVADVWDALTSERPYKKAFSKEDARNKMINDYNSFDEIVLNVFFDSKNNLFQLET